MYDLPLIVDNMPYITLSTSSVLIGNSTEPGFIELSSDGFYYGKRPKNCPNCGAPTKRYKTSCEYCGTEW